MNVKTTVVLLALLVLCGAFVAVNRLGWFEDKEPAAPGAESKLLAEGAGEVRQLSVQTPDGGRIVLLRRDKKWRLAEPIDAQAKSWQAESVVSTVKGLRYVRKYARGEKDFPEDEYTHLSDPLGVVSFTDEKDKHFTLRIGGRPPASDRQTYVQMQGDDHVYVVDNDFSDMLKKGIGDYRETSVVTFETDKAVSIDVAGDESYRLVKAGEKWMIEQPIRARAAQDKATGLLSALSNLSAEAFVEDAPKDLAPYGLKHPRLTVTVELAPAPAATQPAVTTAPATRPEKGERISIAFGHVADKSKNVFAKLADQPWVFKVSEHKFNDLQPRLADLRDKAVLETAADWSDQITRVDVTLEKGGSARLEKSEGKWQMIEPFKGVCDDDAVNGLLSTLKDLKASEFIDNPATLSAFGLDEPKGKIVLHLGADKTTTVLIGRTTGPSGQMGFIQLAHAGSIAVVSGPEFAKLQHPAPAYWSRNFLELPEGATIARVDLAGPGNFTIEQPEEDSYTLVAPPGPADRENVKAALEALRKITADKVVALNKALPPRFAAAAPLKVSLTYRLKEPEPATTSAPATAPSAGETPAVPSTASAPAAGPSAGETPAVPSTKPAPRYTTHKIDDLAVWLDKGKTYVWRTGRSPIAVGELDEGLYKKLSAEMHDRTVLKFDPEKALGFSLRVDKAKMEFTKDGEVWRYLDERYVTQDAEKIKKFLKELGEIKAQRFVDYSDKPALGRFALDKPAVTITVRTDKEKPSELLISRTGPMETQGHYACSSDSPGVFVLSPESKLKISKEPGDFEKK